MKDYIIKFSLDDSSAQAAMKRSVAGIDSMEKAAARAGRSAEKVQQSYSALTRSALKDFALQAGAIGAVVSTLQTLGQAATDAGAKSRQFASKFASQRDQAGELAALMERPNDARFNMGQADFSVKTGMRAPERNAFLTELYNSGAQFKGNKISNAEFDQYAEQVGLLSTAKGYDPAQTGNLAGTVLGFSDYTKYGDQASERALGKVNSGLAILQHGKGRASVLANQFSMLTSSALNEDAMKGTFQDSDEAAMAISIAAEKHDAQAAELVKIATRSLRGFDESQGPLLKKAKITPQTGFIEAIEKLAPVVEAEAREKNLKPEDILRKYTKDQAESEALGVFINKGVTGGGFAERRKFAEGVQGPDVALRSNREFSTSERFLDRQADAEIEREDLERGAENSKLEIIRKKAIASLANRREIDTTSTLFKDYMVGKTSFGLLGGGDQVRIDEEAQRLIRQTAPKGTDVSGGFLENFNFTPTAREADLNRQIERAEAAGGNPLAAISKLLEEQNKMMREDLNKKPAKAPAPLPVKPASANQRPG
jgi:hypothetical protein